MTIRCTLVLPAFLCFLLATNTVNAQLREFTSGGLIGINFLGGAGATALCRNASNQISTCSSSARYKTNIRSFTPGLDIVRRLRPVAFTWADGGMMDFGLVAEEVAAVEPLLTTTNEKGEVEGVKYDRVGVVLVNAVSEQQARIDSQDERIRRQEAIIQQQQERIQALERAHCRITKDRAACKTEKR